MDMEKKGPPKIVNRYELASGEVTEIVGGPLSISGQFGQGGGVLLFDDGTYALQLTQRSFGDQRVVDTDTTPLAGKELQRVIDILHIDNKLKPLPKK